MAKLNCWEVKRCGRQPGGTRTAELGVCAAASANQLVGLHGGKAAGRACWAVAGTLCGGQVQGSYAQKLSGCMACDFYLQVRQEEGSNLLAPTEILARLGRR